MCIKSVYYEDILPYLGEIQEIIPAAVYAGARFVEMYSEILAEQKIVNPLPNIMPLSHANPPMETALKPSA